MPCVSQGHRRRRRRRSRSRAGEEGPAPPRSRCASVRLSSTSEVMAPSLGLSAGVLFHGAGPTGEEHARAPCQKPRRGPTGPRPDKGRRQLDPWRGATTACARWPAMAHGGTLLALSPTASGRPSAFLEKTCPRAPAPRPSSRRPTSSGPLTVGHLRHLHQSKPVDPRRARALPPSPYGERKELRDDAGKLLTLAAPRPRRCLLPELRAKAKRR